MIQIFAEEPFGLLSRAAGLATQIGAKRSGLLFERVGSLTKAAGNIIDCLPKIAITNCLIDLAFD